MSTDAGCTHDGSNGSMPIRPEAIAARMSRSDRTTSAKYDRRARCVGAGEREHESAKRRPRPHEVLRAVQSRAAPSPPDLDRVRAGGDGHTDIRWRISDDRAFARRDVQS